MNAVEKDVDVLVFKELNEANKRFPLFSSPHHGYAVIKEEIEETMDGMNLLLEVFADAWNNIKKNKPVFDQIRAAKAVAENIAVEAIQVAAMCDKYNISLAGENAEHCVSCGEVIPEGIQICPYCNSKVGEVDGV